MAMTIHVDIVSAEASIFEGTAEMVYAPAEMGEVGIAPMHTSLLTRLKPGSVRLQAPSPKEHDCYYVSGGILEVQPHVVTILADTAIRADDLDEKAALEAKQKAEKLLQDQHDDISDAQIKAELAKAVAQLQAIKKYRKPRK